LTPLQTALEAQISEKLRERRLVVWLDADGHYTDFVDSLRRRHREGGFFAPVVAFRGSYLETLLELEAHLEGLDPSLLLVHVPGLNAATVKATPLFEVYKAGHVHQVALETLLREAAVGVAPPEEVDGFLRQGPASLESAEQWLLEARLRDRRGFAAWLDGLPPEWVLDGLLRQEGSELVARMQAEGDRQDLLAYLERHTGFSCEFADRFHDDAPQAFVAWLLAVEYVFDLKREPVQDLLKPVRRLAPALRKVCVRLAQRLRTDHPDRYRSLALRTEELLDEDLRAGHPDELGRIDTFAREDSRLLEAALEALGEGRWGQALEWAESRLGAMSLWLESEPERRQEWVLVRSAAWFGHALDAGREPLKDARNLADALDRYALCAAGDRRTGAQAVDRAHREFESERMRLLNPKLPHFIRLAELAGALRARYRGWADDLGRAFAALCTEEGFLPPRGLQQRSLYDEVVHPLTQEAGASVALVLVDALRFEMACELADHFDRPGYALALKARYAELPSITAVGMNALAPVARDGILVLERPFEGFRLGDYVVRSRQYRLRAMGERSLDRLPQNRRTPVSLTLQQVCERPPDELQDKVRQAPLTVVTSRELDEAGEASLGIATFEVLLGQIRSAVFHLLNSGIQDVVITSDHGFLLQDETVKSMEFGTGAKVDRRYALAGHYESVPGTRSVPLRDLGYEGEEGHLILADDTCTFRSSGRSPGPFVHGGNSLQERVIPVLHLSRRQRTSVHVARYRLEARADQPIAGFSRLRVRACTVQDPQMLLSFAVAPELPVALRVAGDPEVRLFVQEAPRATLRNQILLLKVDQDWTEVLFTLEGERAARARVEVYHPDAEEQVEPFLLQDFFEVCAAPRGTAPGGPSVSVERPSGSEDWQSRFEDEKIRQVFRHLQAHGNLTEEELVGMLGTPRAARRFSSNLDEYARHLPFHVGVEVVGSVKRYVRR